MRIAGLVQDSIVDGPGLRFSVFTQGCHLHCDGCHNPSVWDVNGGNEMAVGDIISEMEKNPLTDGLTLTGGEPFLQAAGCSRLAAAAREKGLDVWAFTGYDFEELLALAETDISVRELLGLVDVLVDGRFMLSERTLDVKWRGSKNQRILDAQKSLAAGAGVEVVF